MSSSKHWLPGKREDQLAMAMEWNTVLAEKAVVYSVLETFDLLGLLFFCIVAFVEGLQ